MMFDESKIQNLADDLRIIVCRYVPRYTTSRWRDVEKADGLLEDIFKRILEEMLENRNHTLSLMETLIQKHGEE